MELEVKKLEDELEILKERVKYLEKKEARRKNKAIIKFIINFSVILFIFISIYRFYQRISEITSLIPFL